MGELLTPDFRSKPRVNNGIYSGRTILIHPGVAKYAAAEAATEILDATDEAAKLAKRPQDAQDIRLMGDLRVSRIPNLNYARAVGGNTPEDVNGNNDVPPVA